VWETPTSHLDLVPTLLGLADVDADQALETVNGTHTEAHALPGRDLSEPLTSGGSQPDDAV
jgi:arylsulfatase A-like enzyme